MQQYVLLDRYVCPVGSNTYCPNNMSSLKRSNMYWSTNIYLLKHSNMYWPINVSSLKCRYCSTIMSSRIGSNMHWLHQYATKFKMIYNTYWNSYRIVQGVKIIFLILSGLILKDLCDGNWNAEKIDCFLILGFSKHYLLGRSSIDNTVTVGSKLKSNFQNNRWFVVLQYSKRMK